MEIVDEVPSALAGERLDRAVALLAGVSRSVAATLVAEGFVRVDGNPVADGKARLALGQSVRIDLAGVPGAVLPEPEPDVAVPVVHVDEHIVVVDKPAGLVVHPATGHEHGTLVNGLLARFPEIAGVGEPSRPGIVHRLDAGTSGLLVVARSARAYDVLRSALARREVDRTYDALVWGHPSATSATIDAPIGRSPHDPLKMAVVVGGKPARTHVTVVETFSEPALAHVRCTLESGRTHQIRVHLAAVGHPVVGDLQYGTKRSEELLGRPFLHASRLGLQHPVSGEHLVFHSPLPGDLRDVLDGLRR